MTNESLIKIAAFLTLLNYLWFSWNLWRRKIEPLSTAGWGMGVVCCAIILGCSICARKPSLLALGYTVGGTVGLVVHFFRGEWKWTWVETVSAILAAIAITLWLTLSPDYGAVAGVIALNSAAIPLVVDMWKEPNSKAAFMFTWMLVAASITLKASLPWSIEGSLLAASGVFYNLVMAILCLRDIFDDEEPSISDLDAAQDGKEEPVTGDDLEML